MRRTTVSLSVVLAILLACSIALGGSAVAAGASANTSPVVPASTADGVNETDGPLADAGLDQSVERNATVLLDGTGSVAGGAPIVAYEWTVEFPNGDTQSPCSDDCARTSFVASADGTYEVTLRVRDAANRTATDTLYVSTNSTGSLSVNVRGPPIAAVDTDVPVVASVGAGTEQPSTIEWYQEGTKIGERDLEPGQRSDDIELRFATEGERSIRAVVVDEGGNTASDVHEVSVEDVERYPANSQRLQIEGPKTILEDDDRTATYEITGSGFQSIRSPLTTWTDGRGGRYGRGEEVQIEWTDPGRYALRANGYFGAKLGRQTIGEHGWHNETDVHVVTVDFAPQIAVDDLSVTPGRVSGTVEARESYSVLSDVTVTVDGRAVASGPTSRKDRLDATAARPEPAQQTLTFESAVAPGSVVELTATATDRRGQTSEQTKTIVVPAIRPFPVGGMGSARAVALTR